MANEFFRGTTGIIVIVALGAGVSMALVGWLVGRAFAAVPHEDRVYKDPPPVGFRLLWWPIQWFSYYLGPFIPDRREGQLLEKLRQAGLDYSLSAAQFMAARFVCAVVVAPLCWWLIGSFDGTDPEKHWISARAYSQVIALGAVFGWLYPGIWLADRLAQRKRELLKTLPFYLDIITLCVEAGLNMQGAMNQAVSKGPKGVLRDEFQRVLRDIRAGKARADALRGMAARLGESSITNFATAVIQAEVMGMNLGPVLRAQADQRRAERFLRAEKLAMEAPVKMLFPLITFIFPCTFIVLFFPIVMKFMHSGL